jgi:hypothetical protein
MDDSAFDEDAFEVPFSREEEFPQLRGERSFFFSDIFVDRGRFLLLLFSFSCVFLKETFIWIMRDPHCVRGAKWRSSRMR